MAVWMLFHRVALRPLGMFSPIEVCLLGVAFVRAGPAAVALLESGERDIPVRSLASSGEPVLWRLLPHVPVRAVFSALRTGPPPKSPPSGDRG